MKHWRWFSERWRGEWDISLKLILLIYLILIVLSAVLGYLVGK